MLRRNSPTAKESSEQDGFPPDESGTSLLLKYETMWREGGCGLLMWFREPLSYGLWFGHPKMADREMIKGREVRPSRERDADCGRTSNVHGKFE